MNGTIAQLLEQLERLNAIGKALSAEKDINRLLEGILSAAMRATHADAGTLYRVHDMQYLTFEIMRTESLGIALGGTSGEAISLPPIRLHDEAGRPNHAMVVARSVLCGATINIEDAYTTKEFDHSGTRAYDQKINYRSQSVLAVPMRNHEDKIIAVMQLINAKDEGSGKVIPFAAESQHLVESLASQAAVVFNNRELISHLEFKQLEQLNTIGKALSAEKDIDRLIEGILLAAKRITHADAGTLYRVHDMQYLSFEIMRTDSLGFALGGTTGKAITLPPIQLYTPDGQPNNSAVAAYAVLQDKTINIEDAYSEEGFDFSGTRFFDQKNNYRSQSFLTVPMKNHENEIIGVLQLINAQDPASGENIPFSEEDQRLVESLASQAAIALTNRQLINQLEELFESFIKLINIAIDDKSPYTGGHCERVPVLTLMLADAANKTSQGVLKDFHLSDKSLYELKIAGLLHDCGKVTTPVHVVDKSTKLETLFDRIHLVDTRFEVLKRDAELELLRGKLAALERGDAGAVAALEETWRERIRQLDDDREFLRNSNFGGEFMSQALQQRVNSIAAYRWSDENGQDAPFLSDDERHCLNIAKGTLTATEREVINHHIVATIKMLEALPWPKHLRNVPEFAGGHHERMDGRGYPRGLTGEQMSLQARMMAIADVSEALTAKDRPYKRGKTLTEALTILGRMKQDHHVDPDLFDLFIRDKVYLRYAREFLEAEQIDEVDESRVPGYTP